MLQLGQKEKKDNVLGDFCLRSGAELATLVLIS